MHPRRSSLRCHRDTESLSSTNDMDEYLPFRNTSVSQFLRSGRRPVPGLGGRSSTRYFPWPCSGVDAAPL